MVSRNCHFWAGGYRIFLLSPGMRKTRNQFFLLLGIHVDTRHPGYKKGTPWNNADYQLQLRTPFIVTFQGKLKSDDGEFAVNRKLFFRYARPLGHTAGVFMLTPDGREKSPDDDATDAVDYLFFDAYERADKLYMLKHLNEETVLIGDNFSPRFACVMNHFAS